MPSCLLCYHNSNSKMKFVFVTLLLCTLLLSSLFAESAIVKDSSLCGGHCKNRCAKAGMLDRCLRYCKICCEQCKCVPSGTYGNKHECACYRDKLNNKGKPKCP